MAKKSYLEFAVGAPDGARSTVWRCISSTTRDDVYFSQIATGSVLKVSLHCDGSGTDSQQFQFSITNEFLNAEAARTGKRIVPLPGGVRHFERTDTFHEPNPGLRRLFALVFPTNGLTEHEEVWTATNTVKWIPPSPAGEAVRIDVFLTDANTSVSGWPGKNGMHSQLIAMLPLASGRSMWIVYSNGPVPVLKPEGQRTGTLKLLRGEVPSDLESLRGEPLRAAIPFKDEHGVLSILEISISIERKGT